MTTTQFERYVEQQKAHWLEYPDGKVKSKRVGKIHVTLCYGTNRGGVIFMEQDDDVKRGAWHEVLGEFNYMEWQNAKSDYASITSQKIAIDFAWRNA